MFDDPAVPKRWLEDARRISREIRQAFGIGRQHNEQAPLLAVFTHRQVSDEQRSFHGDVAGRGMMRLSLFGSSWNADDSEAYAQFMEFFAHEMIHVVQERWADKAMRGEAWVSEGNAEFLAKLLMWRSGIISKSSFERSLNEALIDCALLVGNRSWREYDAKNRGKAPYACGVSLHLVAHLHNDDDPLEVWRRAFKSGTAMTEVDFLSVNGASECGVGSSAICLLLERSFPFADMLAKSVSESNSLVEHISVSELQGQSLGSVRREVFSSLVKPLCGGRLGFWYHEDRFETDVVSSCDGYETKHIIRRIAGVPVSEAIELAQAVSSSCRENGEVVAEADERGLRLPCQQVYRVPNTLIRVSLPETASSGFWLSRKSNLKANGARNAEEKVH